MKMPNCHKCGKSETTMKCVCSSCSAEQTNLEYMIKNLDEISLNELCPGGDCRAANCQECFLIWLNEKRTGL